MSIFTLNNTTSSTDIVHHIVGDIVVQSSGAFDGAVVSFEYSNEEGMPFHILDDFSMTKSDEKLMAIANSSNFRLIVTGAAATTDIKISILRRSL